MSDINARENAQALMMGSSEQNVRKLAWFVAQWRNDASVAGTTAIAEVAVSSVKQKSRLVGLKLTAAAAVTANGTNYFSVVVKKRPLSAPGTPVTLTTFAADTPTTDDLTAFLAKDIFPEAPGTDFDFASGDVFSVEVTKTGGSGLAFPVAVLEGLFEARD